MKDYLASNAEMLISLIFPFAEESSCRLLTVFCKEVNLHKDSRADPERILLLKPLSMTFFVLVCFQAEIRSEYKCSSDTRFEKDY